MSSEQEHRHVETFGDESSETADPLEQITGTVDSDRREQAEKATTTQQADTDEHSGADWYDPPYNPEKLLLALEQSETAKRCTDAISQGVAGYGFSLVPDTDDSDTGDADSEPPGRDTIEEFWHDGDFQLGPDEVVATPELALEHVYFDRVGCGYGTLELLINDATYTPTGAAHIPAHTIRRRRDAPGYVQLDNGVPETFYGPAGGRANDVFVDVKGNVGESAGDVGTLANELLVTNEYSALAPHYGIPPIVPALQTLSADLSAREYQYRFFENDGVPRFVVIVEGGELTERAWDQLNEKLKDLKGEGDAHRGVTIEATGDAIAEPEQPVTVRIEPLTIGEQEDASFIQYRKENEHNIAQAYNVPPVVRGRTESVNYNTALEQRRQFARSEIGPRQQQFATRLSKVIHETMLEVDGWNIEFELHGGENDLRESEIASNRTKASKGARTVNELRSELGYEPLDGAEGEMLVSTLESGSGTTAEIQSLLTEEREDAKADQRAESHGYSITERVELESEADAD